MGLTYPDRRARVALASSCSLGVASASLADDGRGRVQGTWIGSSELSLLGEATIVERARIRCSICRSAVPVTVLWAVGESCPRCSRPLYAAYRRPTPDVALAKAIALLHAESASKSRSSGLARR